MTVRPIIVAAAVCKGQTGAEVDELMAAADRIRQVKSAPVKVLVVTGSDSAGAQELIRATGRDGMVVAAAGLVGYNGEVVKTVLGEALKGLDAAFVLLAHTSLGMDLAPALAVRLGADCLTGITAIRADNDRPLFCRPVYNGKLVAEMTSLRAVTVLTVQPGSFRSGKKKPGETGTVEIVSVDVRPKKSRSLGRIPASQEDVGLSDARVIVAAGNGIGSQENLELVRDLVDRFPGSALAGSRIVCDRGWLAYSRQVGATGTTVAPDLYIACGISGALQHVSGMAGSGFVVAINTDENAAIFNAADVCIVADLTEFIPAFLACCNPEERHSP